MINLNNTYQLHDTPNISNLRELYSDARRPDRQMNDQTDRETNRIHKHFLNIFESVNKEKTFFLIL